jgi:sugar lactone lactonase YvrE
VARTASVLRDSFLFPEGLRWRDGRLWVSDQVGGAVHRIAGDGTAEVVVEVPGGPSGLGWLPDGRLLIVSMAERRLLRLEDAGLVEHASLAHLPGFKLNDMVVDGRGRAYVGDFGFDLDRFVAEHGRAALTGPDVPPAGLARVDPDGSVHVAAEGLRFPNGCAITPDGRTLILAEALGMALLAFDVDEAGNLSNRRVWAPTMPPALRMSLTSRGTLGRVGRGVVRMAESGPLAPVGARAAYSPDGLCLDASGAVWVANARGAECLRVAEGGRILDRVRTTNPAFSCALGGERGRTLYVATAPSFTVAEAQQARGGRIEVAEVDVPAPAPGPDPVA